MRKITSFTGNTDSTAPNCAPTFKLLRYPELDGHPKPRQLKKYRIPKFIEHMLAMISKREMIVQSLCLVTYSIPLSARTVNDITSCYAVICLQLPSLLPITPKPSLGS